MEGFLDLYIYMVIYLQSLNVCQGSKIIFIYVKFETSYINLFLIFLKL